MTKIIFSLTAHEDIDSLHDLISNIKKCFIHYDFLILLSLTESLHKKFNNIYKFVIEVTSRPDELPVWGNINLFHQHMLNMNFIIKNNIQYDYFWFVASNEMFIKIVPPDFVVNNSLKIISKKDKINTEEYESYYTDLMTKNHSNEWVWIDKCKKDKHFVDYLYKNNFKLYWHNHEGMVIPSELMIEIVEEYTKNDIWKKSMFKFYVMEEIFIATYITNKYNVHHFPKSFCFIFIYTLGKQANYDQIKEKLVDQHLSIKPVTRTFDDPLRVYIRNL